MKYVGSTSNAKDIATQDQLGAGSQQVFVQDEQPATIAGKPWIWWKTISGSISDYYVFDGITS